MTTVKENLIFRNFLTNEIDSTKALAFCPDIIPHFGNQLNEGLLIREYDSFISLPLQPTEVNNIYMRAMVADDVPENSKTAVVLRAVPNELILWPQAWNKTKPLGPGPLVFDSLASNQIVAINTPFTFTPPITRGFEYALVATQANVSPDYVSGGTVRLRNALPSPPGDVSNWRGYLDFINNDTTTTYYNVVVADPNAPVFSVTTRLHVVDDGSDPINFNIMVENSSMPKGTRVSLASPSGLIKMAKTEIAEGSDVGVHVSLDPGFDDTITITVYPPTGSIVESFAWISLQASVVVAEPSTGGVPIENVYLLGALNLVFHDDATTNLSFASPATNQLKKYAKIAGDIVGQSDSPSPAPNVRAALGVNVNSFSASGWWFRDALNDGNVYPRTESLYTSPDIQPVGNAPLSEALTILGGSGSSSDYTSSHGIALKQGAPNYVYVRGNCSLSNYSVETRLFCIPNNLLLYPTSYSQYAVSDYNDHGDPYTATRSLTASANSFNVFDTPFDILNLQPPPPGSDHYCLVAETRNPTGANPDPDWPHEDTGAFSSSASFNTWIGSTPAVSWRNIAFQPGGAQILCTCNVTVPANVYPSSAIWTLEVDAANAPVGSSWQLTGSGPAVPGVTIGFQKTTITASNMVQGCHFTGLPSGGYQFSAVLQWFKENQSPADGMKFSFALHTSTPPSGPKISYMSANDNDSLKSLPKEASTWPFTVGVFHPGVKAALGEKKARGYLGRRFKDIGPNHWPYAINSARAIGPTVVYSIGGDQWNFDQ